MMKKTDFKIHILYEFTEGPWGGGNQFLKALRGYFRETGVYVDSPGDAEIILFNSHHALEKVLKVKRGNPGQLYVHRVDGPVSMVRGRDLDVDRMIYRFNSLLADGTVFQSGWSREKNLAIGMKKTPYETTILNAPDPALFNAAGKEPFGDGKVKLIATSWSGNVRRGFDIYKFLDENLDFTRYDMTFVGNAPFAFRNIRWLQPVPSQELAVLLKQHDIYITASRHDPCSNALIEALHCGLPAVARSDGGHPEIVGRAGELFDDGKDVLAAIDRVARDYRHYQEMIAVPSMDDIGARYCDFARAICDDCRRGDYVPQKTNSVGLLKIRAEILWWKALNLAGLSR